MLATYLVSFAFSALANMAIPPPPAHPKGIYLTSYSAINDRGAELISDMKRAGGNMVIIDIQDSDGRLAYESKLPLSVELGMNGRTFRDLPATVRKMRLNGMYVVARFVAFKQPYLASHRSDWALKDKETGRPFTARDGLVWLDPSKPEVTDYLISVADELADMGFDEIQYDYVRFPEAGARGYIGYTWEKTEMDRESVITEFAARTAKELHAKKVKLGLDLFGVAAWNNGYDAKIIGQNITDLSKHVDVIYPMVYPSHFGPGFNGFKNPAGEPYYFVSESSKKFLELMKGGRAVLRPWLQGFAYRVPNYDSWYVEEQIKALHDLGIEEYAIWNASNTYDTSFEAMRKF
ncbi:MAG: putative glycoside hydrolase [Patescibacteria group bacterium]